jgi:hypothetical protein
MTIVMTVEATNSSNIQNCPSSKPATTIVMTSLEKICILKLIIKGGDI